MIVATKTRNLLAGILLVLMLASGSVGGSSTAGASWKRSNRWLRIQTTASDTEPTNRQRINFRIGKSAGWIFATFHLLAIKILAAGLLILPARHLQKRSNTSTGFATKSMPRLNAKCAWSWSIKFKAIITEPLLRIFSTFGASEIRVFRFFPATGRTTASLLFSRWRIAKSS